LRPAHVFAKPSTDAELEILALLQGSWRFALRLVMIWLSVRGLPALDRAGLAAAASPGDATTVDAVLDRFARARLLTLDRHTVEIAHEALLRAWPQLRQWIEAERADLLVQQRVSEAADEWDRDSHDAGALYRGGRLVAAREWAERRSDQVSVLAVPDAHLTPDGHGRPSNRIVGLVQPHSRDLSTSTSQPAENGSKPCSTSQRTARRLLNDHHARITSRSTSVP
jgi:hypothetical protein